MRISEKTVELTFCGEMGSRLSRPVVWFGLTQAQEARAGFDACARLGGQLVLLQFKASNRTVYGGWARRFVASHDQMSALRRRCRQLRSVFYVFSLVGTTAELAASGGLLDHCFFLDVASLPDPVPPPTKDRGDGLRKTRIHYVDVRPGQACMHSRPLNLRILGSEEWLGSIRKRPAIEPGQVERWQEVLGDPREAAARRDWPFSGAAAGMILL